MCVIELFQNPGDFISTLVLFITLVVLIFYTVATYGLKKATVKQTELNLRPFVIICLHVNTAGDSERLIYNNIGHSPALDVKTESFDAEAFFLDFDKQSLIEVGETKALNPKARGKDILSNGFIQAVPDSGFTPSALARRGSDLELSLIVSYKNIEQTSYRTRIQVTKAGIEILGTEKL